MEATKPNILVGMSTNKEIVFESPLADEIVDLTGYSKLQVKDISIQNRNNYFIPTGEELTNDILSKLPEFTDISQFGKTANPNGLHIAKPNKVKNHIDGSAVNVARVLKSLGEEPLLVSPLGMDCNGKEAKLALCKWGIKYLDLHRKKAAVSLNIKGQSKSMLLIYKSPYSINVGDTIWRIERDCGGVVPAISIMVGIRYNDLGLLKAILDKGSEIYLCPSMNLIKCLNDKDTRELFARCTFIQMSVPELKAAFSQTISPWSQNSERHIAQAMHTLRNKSGWQNIIVTNGEKGVFFLIGEEDVYFCNAYPLPGDFLDDTGAGDAFAASFQWHYLQNHDICKAVRSGCVLAAYSITGDGSVERIPESKEANKWLEKWEKPIRKIE